jgi:hypothetical protein
MSNRRRGSYKFASIFNKVVSNQICFLMLLYNIIQQPLLTRLSLMPNINRHNQLIEVMKEISWLGIDIHQVS